MRDLDRMIHEIWGGLVRGAEGVEKGEHRKESQQPRQCSLSLFTIWSGFLRARRGLEKEGGTRRGRLSQDSFTTSHDRIPPDRRRGQTALRFGIRSGGWIAPLTCRRYPASGVLLEGAALTYQIWTRPSRSETGILRGSPHFSLDAALRCRRSWSGKEESVIRPELCSLHSEDRIDGSDAVQGATYGAAAGRW